MKLTNKQKKYFTIMGCMILGLALVVAIGSQFREASTKDVLIQKEVPGMQVIVGELEKSKETKSLEAEIAIDQETIQKADVNALPAQTDKEEQELQEEVTKPEETSEEVLHDPTKTPDGEEVEGAPESIPHEEVKQPEEPPIKKEMPQAGDTSNVQIYIPGFGWVENQGGGAFGSTAGDMYENGNKIGKMD